MGTARKHEVKYGFNGKENDDEIRGDDNHQDYGIRVSDPRIGRFMSVDPIAAQYPELTLYQFASNTPIMAVDIDGLEAGIDMRFMRWDAELAAGKKSAAQIEKEMQYWATGGAVGGLLVASIYTGGRTLPLVRPLVFRAGIWAANPVNQSMVAGIGWTVAGFLDPNPANNYPGPGDDLARGIKMLLKNSSGKLVELTSEVGAKFANESERFWVKQLLEEGKNVKVLAESAEKGKQTADFLIDGVQTELKTISRINKIDPDGLSEGIARTIKRSSGQASNLILDLKDQAGATLEIAERAVRRYYGQGSSKETIRVVGKGFDKIFKKSDFKK